MLYACGGTTKKTGRDRYGNQRFRCRECGKLLYDRPQRLLGDMRIPVERAQLVLQLLCEGASVRAVERLTGTEKKTVLRLLGLVGQACEQWMERTINGVGVTEVQCDEIYGYVRCKDRTKARKGITDLDAGSAYCFVALERQTKMVLTFHLGHRNSYDAYDFMDKLSRAAAGEFQLSTDGWQGFPGAVEYALGARVTYGQIVKEYVSPSGEELRQYAPPSLLRVERIAVQGVPEEKISTSHVERANWTIRTHLRRMTRLSNGFSRKKENLRAALALFFAYYNYCKMHCTLKMTPAIRAGLARRPWSMGDLLTAAMQG